MAGFIGNKPTNVPLSSADIADGTITNDDLAGSITDAKISALSASKLTGSIADARVPASAVTQHVTATDLSPVENDIAILALNSAIQNNQTAHGLNNYWIEQFEDSNSITALTTCQRNDGEYIETASDGTADYTTDPYASGDRTSLITVTRSGFYSDTFPSDERVVVNGTTNSDTGLGYLKTNPTNDWLKFDFGSGVTKLVTGLKWYITNGYGQDLRLDASNDDSSWTTIGSAVNQSGVQLPAELWTGLSHTTKYRYYRLFGTDNGSTSGGNVREIQFKVVPTVANATGSFTSTTITPQDGANKSSIGLVVLYKENAGSTTLNTNLVAKVRANTGQAYQTVTLANKGTFSTGIKIAIAPAISVTAGQALSYEISFAGQSSGSLETQVHGVALQY